MTVSVAANLSTGFFTPAAVLQQTGVTGGGQPAPLVQPSLAMIYLVRIAGDPAGLGEVVPFGGNFEPGGWAEADGRLMNIVGNEALFAVIGTAFGGDGQTTFALPDLRGRAIIGTGQGTGLSNRVLGESLGVERGTLTEAQMAKHDHTLPSGGTTANAGDSQPFPVMQPSLALTHLMPLPATLPGSPVAAPPFLGQVRMFARSSAPANHVPADGRLLPAAQNLDLFTMIGTTYGGDAQSFALPDVRGRATMQSGQGFVLTNRVLGEAVGSEAITMTVDQLAAHEHSLPASVAPTGTTGGGQPVGIMQPTLTLKYIVSTEGHFPSRIDDTAPGFLGQLALFAGDVAPDGWAFADGAFIAISQNTALFSILGTTFGGNGQTTFALPDLRGRVIIGSGDGPGLSGRDNGETTGTESITLAVDQLPPHLHEFGAEATVS